MTADELKKALDAALAPLQATVEAQAKEIKDLKAGKGSSLAGPIVDQVTPHVAACNAAADGMERMGVGAHPQHGHAAMIRRVAAHMIQCAVAGHMPHIYRDHSYMEAAKDEVRKELQTEVTAAADKAKTLETELKAAKDQVASLTTKIADLEAAAKKASEPPARKTQEITVDAKAVLSKIGITEDDPSKVTVAAVDTALAAAGIKGRDAIEAKLKLRSQGYLRA